MNLIELIGFIKSKRESEKFAKSQIPNVEFDQIDVYMKDSLDVNSEILFVDAEAKDYRLETEINGEKYVNLFPLNMLQEMVEAQNNRRTDSEIGEKILEYRIKDA